MKELSELSNTEVSKDLAPEIKKSGKHLNSEAAIYYQQVALNMRITRRKLNLTQQQVADAMNMPRSTYKSLESGKTGIYCYHIAKWSKITGYDVRFLTKGTKFDLTENERYLELFHLIQGLTKEKYEAMLALVKTL